MTAIVTFSGFTESEHSSSGTEELHRKIVSKLGDRDDVKVYDLRAWKADTKGLAAKMDRYGTTRAIIIGYSWGAGYASQKLAKRLARHGIPVPLMLLCDPVYRPTWLPTWGFANLLGFRALIRKSASIKIPANVHNVAAVRQTNNTPSGHPLKRGMLTNLILDRNLLGYTHQTIDAAPEWYDLVKEHLNHLLKP